MATTTSLPAPEAPKSINHFARIFGALFSPKKTLAQIAERPSWVAAVVLMAILATAVGAMRNTKKNWSDCIRHKGEESARFAQLSEDQKDRAVTSQAKFWSNFSYCIGAVAVPISALCFALIYWGAFNLFSGAGLRYGTAVTITSHALLPAAIQCIPAMITLPLKSYGDVDPENILAANVKAFLSGDAPKRLGAVGGFLDLFWVWCMVLAAIGFYDAKPHENK